MCLDNVDVSEMKRRLRKIEKDYKIQKTFESKSSFISIKADELDFLIELGNESLAMKK